MSESCDREQDRCDSEYAQVSRVFSDLVTALLLERRFALLSDGHTQIQPLGRSSLQWDEGQIIKGNVGDQVAY